MGSKPVGIYSASGISTILGLNPYQTRLHSWQLIMEKLRPGFNQEKGYVLPEFPDNAPIRWGHAFEDAVIKLAEEKEGKDIILREQLFEKSFGEISLSCHLDGMIVNGTTYEKDDCIHEGKTTNTRAFYSIKGEDCDDETGEIEFKRRWGDPGTDMVPEEYQIQCAVQRICTGVELVKLSVLVFPKSTQDFEDLGWRINNEIPGKYFLDNEILNRFSKPIDWANTFEEIGNFHTYNLPTNKPLESAIIEKIQEFDDKYVKTELPPEFEDYSDVRRLVTTPMGTIIANDEMITLAREYSEIVRQIGASGPMKKRQEVIKTIISNWMNTQRKSDWSIPSDKLVLIDPNGVDSLISYSKSGFRSKKA